MIDSVNAALCRLRAMSANCLVAKLMNGDQDEELRSCIGGVFFGCENEPWPMSEGGSPLIPWLQIVAKDCRWNSLHEWGLQSVAFYIDVNAFDGHDISAPDNAVFVAREYPGGMKLCPMCRPVNIKGHKFHQIIWTPQLDYPTINNIYNDCVDSVYKQLCDVDLGELDNRSGIKIGGWPSFSQCDGWQPGKWDLQIDSTSNLTLFDSGISYLKRCEDGRWVVHTECC